MSEKRVWCSRCRRLRYGVSEGLCPWCRSEKERFRLFDVIREQRATEDRGQKN